MIDLTPLATTQRLLIEATLHPRQGTRFQPTGFPDLGPATYTTSDGVAMLLVESTQSVANRLEAVCWDAAAEDLVEDLKGLPHVRVEARKGKSRKITSTVLEAHRLNSPYVLDGLTSDKKRFGEALVAEAGIEEGWAVDQQAFTSTIFKYDPSALLHGVFMSNLPGGRARLARVLSGFVEARDVTPAAAGGVKNDIVNPSGDTSKGFGNVPFSRTYFAAPAITAFFSLDLAQLRSLRLGDGPVRLLILLGLYKVRRFLEEGLRFRTECDFEAAEAVVKSPSGFLLPPLDVLRSGLRESIAACKGQFAAPPVTQLVHEATEASSKQSKKAARAAAGAASEKAKEDEAP